MTNEGLTTTTIDADGYSVPVPSLNDIGWLLFGSGVFGVIISLVKERRSSWGLAVPLGLIGLGSGILLKRRQTHMDAAEEKILAELDALDPIARAQVLKMVAKDELGRLGGAGSSD